MIAHVTMPRAPRYTHRIKPHFNPHTWRSTFTPECNVNPVKHTWRHSFHTADIESPPSHDIEGDSTPEELAPSGTMGGTPGEERLIRKPDGEVTRIARGGYGLLDALGWTEDHYNEVQVSRD